LVLRFIFRSLPQRDILTPMRQSGLGGLITLTTMSARPFFSQRVGS